LFVDSYGLAREDRQCLVEAVRQNHNWSYDLMGSAAANGHAGFSDYCASGALDRAAETHQWYLDNGHVLQNALL
jgi:hypothetical protein